MTEQAGPGSFLGALAPADQDEFRQTGPVTGELRRGETLIHEGDPSDFVVLILRGKSRSRLSRILGAETLLATRGTRHIVGGDCRRSMASPRSAEGVGLWTAVELPDYPRYGLPPLRGGAPEWRLERCSPS